MANPQIKIKRSSVAGKIPTADQLPLGELAVNTYDGKVFTSKNVGIGTTVFTINPWTVGVGTNTFNTYFTEGNVGVGNTLPTSTLSVTGSASISGILTADQVYTSNNGNGTNIRIGDDLWIGDINVANTTRFSGAQDSTKAFIVFGNSDAVALGRTGTGPLYYGGNFAVAGVVTAITFSGQINAGVGTITNLLGTNLNYSGVGTVGSLNIGATQVISSARQLQNIASLDATTTATIEAAVASAPNTFTDLNITGFSTLSATSATLLNVSGVTTVSGGFNASQGADLARLRVTGISTLGQTNIAGLSNSGIATLGNATASTLVLSGFSTFSATSATSINISGLSTFSGYVSAGTTVGIGTIIKIVPYDTLNSGTLAFEGSAGQLLSITNNLTSGSIFSVNDVSGIPSIDVNADGTISFGVFGGNIGVGTTSPTSKFTVLGDALINGISTFSGGFNASQGADLARLRVTGVTTFGQTNTTGLSNAGVSTLGNATASTLVVSGFTTASGGASATLLTVSGVATVSGGLLASQGVDAARLRVSGITTLGDATATNLSLAGITTGLNALGISTLTSITGTSANFSGISTFTNGPVFIGSATSTGTASQRFQVTGGAYVSGNLGVGSAAPTSLLTVQGDTLIVGLATANSFRARGGSPGGLGANNNGYGFFGSGDNDSGMYSSADGQVEFYSNSSETARFTSNRNLLIGTISETGITSQRLQVSGGAYVSGSVGIGTTNPSEILTVLGKISLLQNSNSDNRLIFRGQPSSLFRWNIDNNGSTNDFRIFKEDDATAANGATYLGISTGGNVTATTFSGTTVNATTGNIVTGIITNAQGTNLNYSGIGTIGTLNGTTASYAAGNFTTANIVVGIITNAQGTNLNYSGISTLGSVLSGNINSSGVVTATSFVGSGANLTSLNATQLTLGTVPGARITSSGGDFTVGNNLYVNGVLSVGGTSIILNAAQLKINDRDITLGVTTDANGVDISNDNTANHGGISVASTVGTPIITIPTDAVNTDPPTYKQLMWVKQGHYSGFGTDAWILNYGVSIGNTSTVQTGSRLTVGAGFTVYENYVDLQSLRSVNINNTGITTLSGGLNASQGADLARLRVTGITTLGQTNTTGLSNSGISTLGNATASTLNISGVSTLSTISLSAADVTTTSTTTTTTSATAIASVNTSIYRSAVFQIQAVQATNYNMTTINVLHDGTETYMTEYGTINQPVGIATYSTDISAGSLRLLAYPASINSTTFRVISTGTYL
jgi:fibronectin-binding autotransporter adhesin